MFFAIAAPTFDIAGAIVLNATPDSELYGFTRRVSRNTTLDGGVIITDNGFTDADRQFTVSVKPTNTQRDAIARLCKAYPLLTVSTPELCASAACQDMTEQAGQIRMTFLLKARLSA